VGQGKKMGGCDGVDAVSKYYVKAVENDEDDEEMVSWRTVPNSHVLMAM
jgi:hypothetical protein